MYEITILIKIPIITILDNYMIDPYVYKWHGVLELIAIVNPS